MKKFISLISSLVVAAGMVTAFGANAAEEQGFTDPSLYFKAQEATGVEILKSGAAYVNRSVTSENGAVIPAAIYVKDDDKVIGQLFAKWSCESEYLKLGNLTGPVAKYGATPYQKFTDDESMNLAATESLNLLAVNYSSISSADPMPYTADKSDAYPLACFDASFKKDAPGGSYFIKVHSDNPYFSGIICRPTGDGKFFEVDPSENSESLLVNLSDRKLGDVNNDGRQDSVDASQILKAYAMLSSSGESGLSADAAASADVNGDGRIDSVDASSILAYYAYVSSAESPESLNNFIKNRA